MSRILITGSTGRIGTMLRPGGSPVRWDLRGAVAHVIPTSWAARPDPRSVSKL